MRRTLTVITLLLAVALMHALPAYAASADLPAMHHSPPAASGVAYDDHDGHARHAAHPAQVGSDRVADTSTSTAGTNVGTADTSAGTAGTDLEAGVQSDQQHDGHGMEHAMHLCLAILTSLLLALAAFFAVRLAPPTAASISRSVTRRFAVMSARAPDLTALCVSRT